MNQIQNEGSEPEGSGTDNKEKPETPLVLTPGGAPGQASGQAHRGGSPWKSVLAGALIGSILGSAATAFLVVPAAVKWQAGTRTAAVGTRGSLPAIQGPADYEQNTIQVVEGATPGVVQLRVAGRMVGEGDGLPGHRGVPVPDRRLRGFGSGFVYDVYGHIITNAHVVEGNPKVEVVFPDGLVRQAQVLGSDRLSDLAVVKVDVPANLLRPLPLGNSDEVRVGQKTIAIGSPLGSEGGLGLERSPSVTQGIVSARDRSLPISSLNDPRMTDITIEGLIQTDAAINPGNSGGPLLNSRGEVIGVNTAIAPQAQGIGFAVPSNIVRRVVPTLIQGKPVERAALGITFQGLDKLKESLGEEFSKLRLPRDSGALVGQVLKGSAAEAAGLKGGNRESAAGGVTLTVGGDIIIALDGVTITGNNLASEVLKKKPGDKVKLTVVRDGKEQVVEVTLGKR